MLENPNIPNKAPILYVIFTAEVNPTTMERLSAVMVQAIEKHVAEVYLAIATPGGQVQAGIALYNTLRAMPFALTVHNIGSVNSMGNVIFLAGTTRYATAHSTFMFHGVGFEVQSPTRMDEKIVRERLDGLLADQSQMGKIITDRSSIVEDDVAEFFRTQRTVDALWAKDNGIIEDIRDFNIPPGNPVVSFVFQR